MSLKGEEAYVLGMAFTEESLEGAGALKGEDGFSPVITENPNNTEDIYRLDIETKDDKFTTPNLIGHSEICKLRVTGKASPNKTLIDLQAYSIIDMIESNEFPVMYFDWQIDSVELVGDLYAYEELACYIADKPVITTENATIKIMQNYIKITVENGENFDVTIEWKEIDEYKFGRIYTSLNEFNEAKGSSIQLNTLFDHCTNITDKLDPKECLILFNTQCNYFSCGMYGTTFKAVKFTKYNKYDSFIEGDTDIGVHATRKVFSSSTTDWVATPIVDVNLDEYSTNAIQNKAVAEALDGIMNTYISISDLNTRKGTSISLVENEDNTQKIIDALEPREQFIEWFGNSNNRFGINPKTYGSRINEIRITKMTTDATVTAIMDSGAVLSRVYTGGALGDWSSTGHILADGYMDDGTICITGENEDSSGMYGNGVLPETLGFTRDAMTWANGLYRISHGVDLVGLPENLQSGRLEHFNLKRWQNNANPHTATWAERMSIFYSVNGNIYTRVQTSGATSGAITSDTGWRCINQNTKALVTNAQNFKIDLTKRNASWYGMFTFNFAYGSTPCEITVTISDKVYYTITKGQNVISAITYTQDGANYQIGIDFTAKMYGTQVVEMPSEFGTINSLTAETFAGATSAISKGYGGRTYTKLAELGLTADATLDDVIAKVGGGQSATLSTMDFTNYKTLFPYAEEQDGYATVCIEKSFDSSRTIVQWVRKDASKVAYGGLSSNNKIQWWNEYAIKKETLHTSLSGNLAGITTVLDLINALLTEYRALSTKKPVRFVSGEISKTTLTDLPVAYGVLQITVAGWDVVEVRLAHSANGFKSMYYGFLNRISGQESISSITWEKVTTKADLNMMSYSKPSQLGLSDTSCTTVELAQALRNKANNDREINYIGIFDSFDYAVSDAPSRYGKLHIEARASDRLSIRYEGINGSSYDGSWIGKIKGSGGTFSGIEWERVDNTYSTTETAIGTWIDGSTIYRTVVEFNSVEAKTSESEVQVATNIPVATPQKVIRMEGFVNLIGNQFYIHYPNITCNDDTIKATVNIANGNVKLKGTWKYPIGKGALILEYTK